MGIKRWWKRRKAEKAAIRKNAEAANAERYFGPRSTPYLLTDDDPVSGRVYEVYEKLKDAYALDRPQVAQMYQIKLLRMGWYIPYTLFETRQILRRIGGTRYSK